MHHLFTFRNTRVSVNWTAVQFDLVAHFHFFFFLGIKPAHQVYLLLIFTYLHKILISCVNTGFEKQSGSLQIYRKYFFWSARY